VLILDEVARGRIMISANRNHLGGKLKSIGLGKARRSRLMRATRISPSPLFMHNKVDEETILMREPLFADIVLRVYDILVGRART
jgi:hypothetical protein